jgi:GPH family glycoside/pentoside/hexuronide:cation symporter
LAEAAPLPIPSAGPPAERLPLSRIALYALPAASLGFMGGLVSFYLLKFSTDVLLIAPGVMGLIFGASRIWDAVSDPLAGYWSDRTRSRWGRRRPWLALAALPLGLAFVGLWAPPRGLSGPQLAAWMAAGVMLYFTAQTALAVPHASLGAELSADHQMRAPRRPGSRSRRRWARWRSRW